MTNADVRHGGGILWPKIASLVRNEDALVDALRSIATRLLPEPAYKVHRTRVQLDPADHLCITGSVELRESPSCRSRTLAGELFRVGPRRGD